MQTEHVLPIANMLGMRLHHKAGAFEQDFILNSETDLYPYFDLSPAYLASMRLGPAFKIGAGVNFYRAIPIEPEMTTPFLPDGEIIADRVEHPYDQIYIYVDTTGPAPNTTVMSFKGTKVMATVSLDPKAFFGGDGIFGAEDLMLYAEVAVIGLDQSKAYNAIYGGLGKRMPVMVGFNLPMFGFLDHLSLEAEWYRAPFRDDLTRYLSGSHVKPASPIPVSNGYLGGAPDRTDPTKLADSQMPWADADVNKPITKDDFKWSLHGARIIQNHFKVSFQVANDHFRPGGPATSSSPSYEAILTTPKDWYWMTKVAYFF